MNKKLYKVTLIDKEENLKLIPFLIFTNSIGNALKRAYKEAEEKTQFQCLDLYKIKKIDVIFCED